MFKLYRELAFCTQIYLLCCIRTWWLASKRNRTQPSLGQRGISFIYSLFASIVRKVGLGLGMKRWESLHLPSVTLAQTRVLQPEDGTASPSGLHGLMPRGAKGAPLSPSKDVWNRGGRYCTAGSRAPPLAFQVAGRMGYCDWPGLGHVTPSLGGKARDSDREQHQLGEKQLLRGIGKGNNNRHDLGFFFHVNKRHFLSDGHNAELNKNVL